MNWGVYTISSNSRIGKNKKKTYEENKKVILFLYNTKMILEKIKL